MRNIDYYFGPPILWALRTFVTSRVNSLGGDHFPHSLPKSVLIMKFVGAGSITLSFPLLKKLKEQGVKITFLTFPSNAGLLKMSGLVDHVVVIQPSLHRFVFSVLNFVKWVRRTQIAAVIDLEPTANFTAVLAGLSGIKTRVGFLCGLPKREAVFTHLVAINTQSHMAADILATVKILGLKINDQEKITLPPCKLPKVTGPSRIDLLNRASGKIILNTTSSELLSHLRNWPQEKWSELGSALLKHTDFHLVFTGMNQDRETIESIRQSLPQPGRAYNLAGFTTMPELIALIQGSELVVTLDTGIAHLAAWTATPQVCLFGPETPGLYGPVSDQATIIWKKLHCSPCVPMSTGKRSLCLDNQCMKQITVDEVLSACLKKLNKRQTRLRA